MHIIARCFKNSRLATIAFVLANIVWVFGIGEFVWPEAMEGFYSAPRTKQDMAPFVALDKLECPTMLNSDGQGMVAATVVNPFDEIHEYIVKFYVSAYPPYNGFSYPADEFLQESCYQVISIPPKQSATASCEVNRPDLDTDGVAVTVHALGRSYVSQYQGFCIIQSGRMPIAPAQIQGLVSSVIALLVIGWTFAIWKYLGTISHTIVILVGGVAWALIAFLIRIWQSMVGIVNIDLAVLFLLLIIVVTASILLISHRLQKNEMGTNNSP